MQVVIKMQNNQQKVYVTSQSLSGRPITTNRTTSSEMYVAAS